MRTLLAVAAAVSANKLDKKGSYTSAVAAGMPIISCPEGYTQEGNRCAKQLIQPQIATCQEGVLQPDNTCLIIQGPLKICPADYVAIGNGCSRTRTAAATLSCPMGYAFEPGHKKAGGVCTKTETVAQWGCPGGTIQQGDICVSEHRVVANIQCPEGTLAQGLSCIHSEIYDCTTGPAYVHKHETHGHKRVLAEDYEEFDLGFEFDESAVERELKKLKGVTNVYPQEQISVVQQKCERRVSVNPLVSCPKGTLVGRECVYAEQQSMVPISPAVNLQTAAPTATCPGGYSPCATGKKKVSSDCCATEETPVHYQCPGGFSLQGDLCQAVRQADWICSTPGYTKHKHHNQQCVQTQYVEPTITYSTQVTCVGKECTEAKVKHSGHGGHNGNFLY
ncbi:putative oocyst wall protein [Gregarina niphandrodes]|uniref:Oocyst wall protein n=1 Tax=Gregarina niphandrodes TaxID=110365 RepID=A0A023AYV2_GRENI|nr:putative oocyst wall protein [Gregarina niphandrodes]EZG43841.1 putative oocyst wall protein [Gregarina niphandrodes]|eukprot:XP_011132962.1 putative oocyst wall protein [Gregarina niphandrodes]